MNEPIDDLDYSYTTPDALDEMLQAQDAMQADTYGLGLKELLPSGQVVAAVNSTTMNVLAATDELHELLGETSWKPWAKADYINLEAARGEWIDAWHFMMNLANLLGLDSAEIKARYFAKRAKNIARQEAGYDGISTKCPGCHRALDDDAVHCWRGNQRLGSDDPVSGVHCVVRGRFIPDGPSHPRGGTHLEGSFT
ncbi:deoxyuridine triphosphatase [Microbacterium phage Albright]|uniref:deoxyuridine triphosphatase n=1 Tax=Microbacterium phage Albright TaxID=2816467 RepID=UPI001BB5ADA1|nr:deoxyuridine triphosphatase [Microbacterium phage Albright]YP_010753941.1 deoxyuridine triphosphatase [Microbacterium phage CroZenni]QTF82205.1 deoxyuridine triphosphatase [Microbacterium phage Albright]QWY79854.1 deoxyuridine triphosphatase [Microbacterium phage CroZenni]